MKRKVLTCGLILAMTAGMLAGCGEKKVEYGFDEDSREVSSESGITGLADLAAEEKWSDEWTITDEKGRNQVLKVDAEVIVPDVDTMSVVEVKRSKLDAQLREKFLKAYFENEEIYYYDEAHWTKDRLYDEIEQLEAEAGQWDDVTNGRIGQEIDRLHGLLAEASDEYTVAEDFTSCNVFAGYRGDIFCAVSFDEGETAITGDFTGGSIWADSWVQDDGAPKSLSEYDEIAYYGVTESSASDEELNECRYTKEEARNIADSFLNEIGISDRICTEEGQNEWGGMMISPDGTVTDEKHVNYGYSFFYSIGLDGIVFSQYPHYGRVDTQWDDEAKPGDLFDGENISILVTDAGVNEVIWREPLEISNISDSVELLPLNTVKGLFESEVTEHADRYDFGVNMAFQKLELTYMSIKDTSEEGVFSYVPVWRLTRSDSVYPILINAVDGSVLYILETPSPQDVQEE